MRIEVCTRPLTGSLLSTDHPTVLSANPRLQRRDIHSRQPSPDGSESVGIGRPDFGAQ
jgi:hypothetical protein